MEKEGEEPHKVAVFGGGGAVGSCLISLLQNWDIVSQLFCIDTDEKRAKEFIKDWNKIILIKTDGNGYEKLIKKLKGCYLIVNAATSKLNRWIMKIALEINSNYLDFASFNDDVAEQKCYHDRYVKAKKSAWINWGIGPGWTNTMAARLIRGLTNCFIKIWVAEDTICEDVIFLWNPKLVINEITSRVPIFSKNPNRAKFLKEPLECPEIYTFPEPIGKITCYDIDQNEGITFQDLPNVEEIIVKSGGRDIENMRKKLVKVKKYERKNALESYTKSLPTTPPPRRIIQMQKQNKLKDGHIAIVVEVNGIEPATEEWVYKKATWMGLSLKEVPYGTTHISWNTALVSLCAIQEMVNAEKLEPGVWPPEFLAEHHLDNIYECVQGKTHKVL